MHRYPGASRSMTPGPLGVVHDEAVSEDDGRPVAARVEHVDGCRTAEAEWEWWS